MLFFVLLVIALGWAAFAFVYGRERLSAKTSSGLMPNPYVVGRSSPLAAPRTAEMARIRRQQVLAALVVAAALTYFMTRLWSLMWGPHILIDVALITFAFAVYTRSAGVGSFNQPVTTNLDEFEVRAPAPAEQQQETVVLNLSDRAVTPAPIAQGWVAPTSSVLSTTPRSSVSAVVGASELQLPDRRFSGLAGSARFAPVAEDERTSVRPGPLR